MYTPIKPLEVLAEEIGVPVDKLVKLDANENLYGPIPEIMEAISRANLHIYPDPSQNHFRAALSKYLGVPANCIVGGTGSDDNIDILIRLVDPHTILITTPTFGMYSFLGKIDKARIVDVPRVPQTFELDFDAIAEALAKLPVPPNRVIMFFASPNNPTGNPLSIPQVEKLCSLGATVVIDEAYLSILSILFYILFLNCMLLRYNKTLFITTSRGVLYFFSLFYILSHIFHFFYYFKIR